MQLNISGRHFDVTDAIKQHAKEKISKIKQHFDHLINVNMVLEIENGVHKSEATVHISGADLFAKAESDDMYTSIDRMINKLDTQVIKHKEKLNDHRKN